MVSTLMTLITDKNSFKLHVLGNVTTFAFIVLKISCSLAQYVSVCIYEERLGISFDCSDQKLRDQKRHKIPSYEGGGVRSKMRHLRGKGEGCKNIILLNYESISLWITQWQHIVFFHSSSSLRNLKEFGFRLLCISFWRRKHFPCSCETGAFEANSRRDM